MIQIRGMILAFLFVSASFANAATFVSATVVPSTPTPADPVVLNLTLAAVPTYQVLVAPLSIASSGSTINVTYAGQTSTGPLPPPVPIQTMLGQFAPGVYHVNVYVQPVAFFGGPPIGGPILEQATQFEVSAPQVIPTIGGKAWGLLMVLLVVAGYWEIRRTHIT
jgi:hypothetical protein